MLSVFDQLDWSVDTDAATLINLVSTQLDSQNEIREKVRKHLEKDYSAEALTWLPTVTWSPPTLVPLSSFDLRGIEKWPTWDDKAKIRLFTEKMRSGWHKAIVAIKVPGARYLLPVDGHTRLSVDWKLKQPVLAWVGKAHTVHGPWESFHRMQRGMDPGQKAATGKGPGFSNVYEQLLELADGQRHVRTARGVYFFHEPIGTPITEAEYQSLLAARKAARSAHEAGHPDRVAAERAVRQARRSRKGGAAGPDVDTGGPSEGQSAVASEVAETQQSADQALSGVRTEIRVTKDSTPQGMSDFEAGANSPLTDTGGTPKYNMWGLPMSQEEASHLGTVSKPFSAPVTGASETAPKALSHSDLLQARKQARSQYPPGHPTRVAAERAVRQSRSSTRSKLQPSIDHPRSPEEAAIAAKPNPSASELSAAKQQADIRSAIQRVTPKTSEFDLEKIRIAVNQALHPTPESESHVSQVEGKKAEAAVAKLTSEEVDKLTELAKKSEYFTEQDAERIRAAFDEAKTAAEKGVSEATKLAIHAAFILAGGVLAALTGAAGVVLSPVMLGLVSILPPVLQELVDKLLKK